MPYQYLCANHAKLVRDDENQALHYWDLFMRRGRSGFSDCRWQGAEVYLSAAIDVAAIRLCSKRGFVFSFSHVIEPLSMLCKMYIAEQSYTKGYEKLDYVKEAILGKTEKKLVEMVITGYISQIDEAKNCSENDVFGLLSKKPAAHSNLDTRKKKAMH